MRRKGEDTRRESQKSRTARREKGRVRIGKERIGLHNEQRLEEVLSRPISSLISSECADRGRITAILNRAGIGTVGDLIERNKRELHKIKGIGWKTLGVLEAGLWRLGISCAAAIKKHTPQGLIELLKIPINTYFSVRTMRFLQEANTRFVFELVQLKQKDVISKRNIGRKGLIEIRKYLTTMGLSLGMNLDEIGFEKPQEAELTQIVLQQRIEDLCVSGRVIDALHEAGIEWLYQLVEKSEEELRHYPIFRRGKWAMEQVKEALSYMGISLGMNLAELGLSFAESEEKRGKRIENLAKSVWLDEIFSIRTVNFLYNGNIHHILDLVQTSETDLRKIKGFQVWKRVREVKEILASMDLYLGMRLDEDTISAVKARIVEKEGESSLNPQE